MSDFCSKADDLSSQTSDAGTALQTFADDLDTVKTTMNRAREVATGGGLTVTPNTIQPPDPGPGDAPQSPSGRASAVESQAHSEAMTTHDAAVAEHKKQVRAYRDAKEIVDGARNTEGEAHRALSAAMDTVREFIDNKSSTILSRLSDVTVGAATMHGGAKSLLKLATDHRSAAAHHFRIYNNPAASASQRAVNAVDGMIENAKANVATVRADSMTKWMGNLANTKWGGATLKALTASPADLINAGGRHAAPAGRFVKAATPVLRNVPYVGGLVTAAGIGNDIRTGEDVDQAVVTGVGSFAAGAATTALIAGAVAGGPATLAAVGIGAAVTWGVGELGDRYYDDAKEIVSDGVDAVGDGAKAVGEGAKKAWDSVF